MGVPTAFLLLSSSSLLLPLGCCGVGLVAGGGGAGVGVVVVVVVGSGGSGGVGRCWGL